LPVHDKEFVLAKDATSLPSWQRAIAAVAFARLSHLDAIDGDCESSSTNGLSWQGYNSFEHGKPGGQVTIQIKESRE
jgi:hypothetical protein